MLECWEMVSIHEIDNMSFAICAEKCVHDKVIPNEKCVSDLERIRNNKVVLKKIAKCLRFLAQNPSHPGLNLERIINDPTAWSARVDKKYRLPFEPSACNESGAPDWTPPIRLLRFLTTTMCTKHQRGLDTFCQGHDSLGRTKIDLIGHFRLAVDPYHLPDRVAGSALFHFRLQVSHAQDILAGSDDVRKKKMQPAKISSLLAENCGTEEWSYANA